MKEVNPTSIYQTPSNFSHGVITTDGKLVFTSGAIGLLPDGSLPADFEGQTRQVWKNISVILEDAGSSLDKIVRVNGFLKRREDAGAYRSIRDEVLSQQPASTIVIAELIDDAWLIEVEVVAEI